LTDAATGLKVKMKSSNIDETKVDAENYLKELWGRVERSYKRNLGIFMNNKKYKYDFVTVGNRTYQFKDGKLKYVIKW